MSPVTRRIIYAVTFESGGILMGAAVLRVFSGAPAADTLGLSILGAVIALLWSYIFNAAFERWERRQVRRGRSFLRRSVHALMFEIGLTLILLPATAWFLSVGLAQALIYELGLVLFYLGYAWVFTFGFDRVFGLPESAR